MKPIWEYSVEHWPAIFIITLILGIITQNLIKGSGHATASIAQVKTAGNTREYDGDGNGH